MNKNNKMNLYFLGFEFFFLQLQQIFYYAFVLVDANIYCGLFTVELESVVDRQ